MPLPGVVLYQPRIPPNAGNIIRLCANTGAELHFIHPLGFTLEHAHLRRAGLDYHELARVHQHRSLEEYIATHCPLRIFAFSTSGAIRHDRVNYTQDDALVFGPETTGLPADVLTAVDETVRIPMRATSRSMNLANSVAVAVYEAWRQQGFPDGA